MILIFYILLFFFLLINVLKAIFSVLYIRKNPLSPMDFDISNFSIVQPIMSGDETLENNLRFNLDNTKNAHFIWLLDSDDNLAHQICEHIKNSNDDYKNRVDIVSVDNIPNNCNRKTYKMCKALAYAREYFVAVDDDTKITYGKIANTIKYLKENPQIVVTAYPYYKSGKGFYSKLVASFVNANSLFLYLGGSFVHPLKMLSGMFYVTRTENLKSINAFENILYNLSDELALAELLNDKGFEIKLLPIPFQITTTIYNLKQYLDLMKKWFVFFLHYFKKDFSPGVIVVCLFPAILPSVLLIYSLLLQSRYFLIFLSLHVIKTLINMIIRINILKLKESFYTILSEPLVDYLQIIHLLHATIFPNSVIWRGKKIKLNNNKIQIEN